MRICFQAIFYKTVFFQALAARLEESGHDIYWISTSGKWVDWLIDRGVDQSRILLLQRRALCRSDAGQGQSAELVTRIETEYGLPLKAVYYMDRVIRTWPWEKARAYMTGVAGEIDRFLGAHDIEVVLGEASWAHEILCAAVCRIRQTPYYQPGTARIPSDRFLFFENHLQTEYQSFEGHKVNDVVLRQADEVREKVIAGLKPNYWYWNNKIPAVDAGFLRTIQTKVHEASVEARSDATVKSLKYHLKHQRQYLKPMRYSSIKLRSVFQQPVRGEKYVLYTLHKQPEASIDVYGAEHSDQLHLIRQTARHLGADTWLYVKEHSNSLGDRTRRELKQITRIPGVRLIDPHCDVHELIRGAEAVLTVSGTVAFEAALYGKPAGTFSRMYFSGLSSIRHIRDYAEVESLIGAAKTEAGWTDADRYTLAHIIANSFEGVIGDPLATPVCMLEENIKNVTNGIECLCNELARKKPTAKSAEPEGATVA